MDKQQEQTNGHRDETQTESEDRPATEREPEQALERETLERENAQLRDELRATRDLELELHRENRALRKLIAQGEVPFRESATGE